MFIFVTILGGVFSCFCLFHTLKPSGTVKVHCATIYLCENKKILHVPEKKHKTTKYIFFFFSSSWWRGSLSMQAGWQGYNGNCLLPLATALVTSFWSCSHGPKAGSAWACHSGPVSQSILIPGSAKAGKSQNATVMRCWCKWGIMSKTILVAFWRLIKGVAAIPPPSLQGVT